MRSAGNGLSPSGIQSQSLTRVVFRKQGTIKRLFKKVLLAAPLKIDPSPDRSIFASLLLEK